jgi:hypothetical protein
MSKSLKTKIIILIVLSLGLPIVAGADFFGQRVNFTVDPAYDSRGRTQVTTTLRKIFTHSYFYIDDAWWDSLSFQQKDEIDPFLNNLGLEFDSRIYPILTSNFGYESRPGIDKDDRITILIHSMTEEAGGYFRNVDSYSRFQAPGSNEREMIYLNTQHIQKSIAKSLLAHEFLHLITLSQKDLTYGISEETWLNEARSEYASTLLGYDNEYPGSNLERRVKAFLEKPNDSLTEWQNLKYDYGVINLFTQYLIDHYGIKILVDSLQSNKVGIDSLNFALRRNGFSEDFSQIFTNWTIAVLVNDCNLGEKYCYLNSNLKNLRVPPQITYLPATTESFFSANYVTKNWSGNWFKIIGGRGNLNFDFEGDSKVSFKVSYFLCDNEGKCSISFLSLNSQQKGNIFLKDFYPKYSSLTIIPVTQNKTTGAEGIPQSFMLSLKIQISLEKTPIQQTTSCQKLASNLYFGLMSNQQVRCLQEFLKAQGTEIYPEGLVTGNFLSLTKKAVIRFQEKYASEILLPWGINKGTGFVGLMTLRKINSLLGS